MNRIDGRIIYFLIASVIIVSDQITKTVISSWLSPGQIIRLFDNDLVWLVLVHNPGSAFGIRLIPTPLLAVISMMAAIVLSVYLFRYSNLPFSQGAPLGLILGGAVGNMIDRIRLGKVVDFVSVNLPDFWMDRWPVFNVADSAVSVGVVWMILVTLFVREQVEPDEDDKSILMENQSDL